MNEFCSVEKEKAGRASGIPVLFIITEHSDQVYEGKTEYVKQEVIEVYRKAAVLCVSP